jgi:hypothetical protein
MNSNQKKIVNLLSGEISKFDGLSEFIEKLAAEIQSSIAVGEYENASCVAKQLVAIFEVLDEHRKLDMKGQITVPDVDNLKPKIVSCLEKISRDDGRLRVFGAASVHVNLDTVLILG